MSRAWSFRAAAILGLALAFAGGLGCCAPQPASPTPPPSTAEPLVPTARPRLGTPGVAQRTAGWPGAGGASPQASPPGAAAADATRRVSWTGRARFGVGLALQPAEPFDLAALHAGWYLDWSVHERPARPGEMDFVQVVRLQGAVLSPDTAALAAAARANPGALWLIGNEPDVRWQDNVTPEVYARLYEQAYRAIKSADPSAVVAMGGIAQPTPLRMAYLDRVLTAYQESFGQPAPVDAWAIHAFILREERGSWGVDIPPGMDVEEGLLYEVVDHDNLELFAAQVLAFRRWMAERGQREKPLIVSEYGLLMPADYGFPPERVEAFMRATFDFFAQTKDSDIGNPADGDRLVQRWCWFSAADPRYPTGNLFDPETGRLTRLGEVYRAYLQGISEP